LLTDPATTRIYPLSLHDALPILVGTGATLLVCAGGYLAGVLFLLLMRGYTQEYSDRRRSPVAELAEGWRYITSTPLITMVLILADRKSTRLNSSHVSISYAVFCL